jgi:hypothetical protein
LAFFGINLGSLWLYLGSFWVRFFTIVNNDGQSLGSFFQKTFFGQDHLGIRADQPVSRGDAKAESGLMARGDEPGPMAS